jgi:2-phosphosulfolactate phosphatase
MRVHVALMPGEFPDLKLDGRVALVVDVFRATSMVVAAFGAGCARVIPVANAAAAREKAAAMAPLPVLLAGERGGDPIEGFDLGNSPLDCTADRVSGRTLVLTTTNGTHAMLKAGEAEGAAIAALTNVGAAARWAAARGRDITVLCAGEQGRFSLEDAVCGGLLVERLLAVDPELQLSDAAQAARCVGLLYGADPDRLKRDAAWARQLHRRGRAADLDACVRIDTASLVPEIIAGAVTPGSDSLTWTAGEADTRTGRDRAPGANR